MKRLSIFIVTVLSLSLFWLESPTTVRAAVNTFSNPTNIVIPTTGTSGPSNPYPSAINVTGVTGTITDVDVTLNSLSHTFAGDLYILLVGPGGQKVILMADAGGGNNLVSVNITFSDGSPTIGPIFPACPCTFSPSDLDSFGDSLPGPAPARPYGTALSVFNNLDPNGTWNLYIWDDATGDVGNLAGGWTLTITTSGSGSVSNVAVPVIFTDGRVNNLIQRDSAPAVVIYCTVASGITVYGVDSSSRGYLLVHVPYEEIESTSVPEEANVTLASHAGVLVSRLTTGEFQVNATYWDGRPYIVVWNGCPSGSYYHISN